MLTNKILTIKIEPKAAIIGSNLDSMCAKIRIGSVVVNGDEINKDKGTLINDIINDKMNPAVTPDLIKGNVMKKKVCILLAPRFIAASSTEESTKCMLEDTALKT